jgi:hypothetical protein
MVSLKGFLAENSISRSTWYRMEPRPRVVRIGRKILIRVEDAAAWRERLAGVEGFKRDPRAGVAA